MPRGQLEVSHSQVTVITLSVLTAAQVINHQCMLPCYTTQRRRPLLLSFSFFTENMELETKKHFKSLSYIMSEGRIVFIYYFTLYALHYIDTLNTEHYYLYRSRASIKLEKDQKSGIII